MPNIVSSKLFDHTDTNPGAPGKNKGPTWARGQHDDLSLPNGSVIGQTSNPVGYPIPSPTVPTARFYEYYNSGGSHWPGSGPREWDREPGRQLIVLVLCPPVFDRDVLVLDVTGFSQASAEGEQDSHALIRAM
jgi:hypothetical protein